MKLRLVALGAASVVAVAAAAQSPAQTQTTAPPAVVTVKITVTDTSVSMKPRVAQRGTMAQFVLVNKGTKHHTFALGDTRRGTGRQTGFIKPLKPNEQAVLVLFLDYRGALPYRALLPADQLKPAMKGTFRIT